MTEAKSAQRCSNGCAFLNGKCIECGNGYPRDPALPQLPPLDKGLVDFPQQDNAADVLNQVAIRQCRERQLLAARAESTEWERLYRLSEEERMEIHERIKKLEAENESLKAEAERFLTQAHNAEGNAVYQQRRAQKAEAELATMKTENESLKTQRKEAGALLSSVAVASGKPLALKARAEKAEAERDKLLAENESLKAQLAEAKAEHGKTLMLLNKAAFETIPALEAERSQALEVIREYRERRGRYDHGRDCLGPAECGVVDDDRCPICIKADELLSRETKEEV